MKNEPKRIDVKTDSKHVPVKTSLRAGAAKATTWNDGGITAGDDWEARV